MRMNERKAPTWRGDKRAGRGGAISAGQYSWPSGQHARRLHLPGLRPNLPWPHRQHALLHVQRLEVTRQQHSGQLLVLRDAAQALVAGQVEGLCLDGVG